MARALNDSVTRLSASSDRQNENLSRQAASLLETQVTAEEIRQTSKVAAEKAALVLEMTKHADEIGRSGETAVEQSAGAMTEIRTVAGEIVDKMRELSERARQLGVITDAVKGIADQSSMLAVNAAIEAVRSGEHGKGFGVVAKESVASRTGRSSPPTRRGRSCRRSTTRFAPRSRLPSTAR